ncbi:protein SMG5 isoform X1 [Drosophila persimilis]|uniref:protein SMG5 isoform X1 n=1 Tax=Drosophila persimilis TaxID=7234 RepID=UPI000F092295|nr:protein SMG5 isoform X1 [Drosophila persimilis]XP_026842943.1 protein SMG5 isoform X1 [Drosophila persimilis]XP_026842944.1 protein SMG5 isoform X1 [Drosophila persimilis]
MEATLSSGGSNASSECAMEAGNTRSRCLEPAFNSNGHCGNGNGNGAALLSQEVKDLYRSLYTASKQLDEAKKNVQSVEQLFQHEIEEKRSLLVQLCKEIIFKDYQSVGKKIREVMWRRGYYEFIAFVKKNWHKQGVDAATAQENMQKLERFLCAGIFNYKRLSSKMEEIYDLDLKYLIDFSIISDGYISDMIGEPKEPSNSCTQAVDKSLEAVSFALDTIHSSLLSLGDLHRYFLDFRIDSKLSISKEQVAKYYLEAFKLNPAIGMAQNQLGTLYYGQNYDLDSTYHYLYSLVCIIPFELSENNLNKLFAKHTEYLEQMDPNKLDFNIEDFFARFYLIVDIFFFDKEVPDFNALCHCVLIDLRKILCSQQLRMPEPSIYKIISILFFCLSKLKMINSPKVYSLHAFLVAACSDLMDACIVSIEQTILARSADNEQFQADYEQRFEEFDTLIRKSRNEYKNWLTAVGECERKDKKLIPRPHSLKDCSSDSRDSQRSVDDVKTQETGDGEKNPEPISTRSSDEAKESDLKTPLSCKSKRRGMRLRRRRRKIAQSDDSSCYDSESDMDTDFYSDEEDYTDLSSNFDTDFSDIDAADPGEPCAEDPYETAASYSKKGRRSAGGVCGSDIIANDLDDEDVVIEEEKLVYPELERRPNSQEADSEELLHSFEVLQLNFKSAEEQVKHVEVECPKQRRDVPEGCREPEPKPEPEHEPPVSLSEPPKKLIYRNKYTKINPNIIIDCLHNEPTIRALKMLFDWLRVNPEILIGCYHSNPEFVHKIMKLLNYCNIDVFTRKVYFERELLTTSNVREALVELFDVRANVPLSEDFTFKNFDIFQSTQITLDWETIIRERVTPQEESILRIFKMVDFGFFICKQKKFNYRFCVKTRRFTENQKKKQREEKKGGGNRRRERRTAPKTTRKRNEGRTRRYSDRKNGIVRKSYTSNEEKDTVEECRKMPRKGYLRNRNAEKAAAVITSATGTSVAGGTSASTTTNSVIEKLNVQSSSGADEERSEAKSKKCELMGKLWLQNEVETLEEELRDSPPHVVMSPFVVVDSKALTEYNGIVKSLVRTKKCIVLIPNAVLNELDDLKKRSENVRHVIRWLEQEFKHGNRHLRAQRDNESQPLSLLKISRKMDRDASVFLQIAQFCNHLVANHADPHVSELQKNVVTYLSGDNLHEKNRQQQNFSYTGILDSIPARYAQIQSFYSKFKANKK